MRIFRIPTLLAVCVSFVFLSAQAVRAGELVHPYNVEIKMTFGMGYGEKSVRDLQFDEFLKDTIIPMFKDGSTAVDAWGQWVHPQRGLLREPNIIVYSQHVDGPETDAKIEKIAQTFLRRYPGSHASVYIIKTPISEARVVFQE